MQTIQTLFQVASAPAQAQRTVRNKKLWTPEFARFKLQFKFRDGSTSIPYHSYDIHRSKGGKNLTDESIGFSKLLLLIEAKRSQDTYVVATVWANLTDDLRTYINERLNMNYDHIVFKHVRGQNPYSSPYIKFRDGKLDVPYVQRLINEGVQS